MTYKTISFTPKGEIADAIYDFCRTKAVAPDGKQYGWIDTNPQDLVRTSLEWANIVPKVQPCGGDKSCWEPGLAIKTSFWQENAMAVTDFAKEQGMSRQDLIRESVMDFIREHTTL